MKNKKMKLLKIFLLLFTIVILFCGINLFIRMRGLSNIPEYYTDQEIDEYVKAVYGDECKFVRKEEEHEYIYEDVRGIQFPVSAISDELIGVSWMGRQLYRKTVFDNYWESVMEYYEAEIEAIAEKNGMDVAYFQYVIVLRARSMEDVETAAAVMEEIDHLLGLSADYDNGKLHRYEITVVDYRLKICLAISNRNGDEWIFNEKIRVCEFEVSTDKNNRLTKEMILNQIN